ncbi:redoxin domain-containing protein [Carboxylicivirga sp. RSCT41]|uniref:redoxin domain-containing protein n=1 Tax=Carboxylicivirga agarovorans TaxID=3417570 RepID=UPI003D349036
MTKYTVYIAILIFSLVSCNGEKIQVEGHVINSDGKKVTLEIMDGARRVVIAECAIVNNQFDLTGKLEKRSVLGIYIDDDVLPVTKLEAAGGHKKVVVDHQKLKNNYTEGRRIFNLQRTYRQHGAVFNNQLDELKTEIRIKKKMAKSIYEKQQAEKEFSVKEAALRNKLDELTIQAIRDNADTEWALFKLAANAAIFDKKVVLELQELFRDKFKDHDAFGTIERLMKIQMTKIGDPAIGFTIDNAQGQKVSLADYKGKVVIIDFWASWCKPCRAANPMMVELYNKYKGKGLEIIGISLDTNKESWLQAVKQDKLPWEQLSTLEGFECPVGFKYGVTAIPHLFVVDKEGILRGNRVHGPELEELINELL